MSTILPLVLLGLTALLGITLASGILREVKNPVLLRRVHLLAGASALFAVLRAVRNAAAAVPPVAGPSGLLPFALLVCALLLGMSLWLVARYAQQGLTIARTLHICAGFCAVVLAAAWVARPGG